MANVPKSGRDSMPPKYKATAVPKIRPLAIVLLRRGERLLVMDCYDSVKRERFYRPVGGGIEFGETAAAAARREIREELDARLRQVRLAGVLENLFTCEGNRGHEIVFVYEAEFADNSLYRRKSLTIHEGDLKIPAVWKSLREMKRSRRPLYPDGLEDLLANRAFSGPLPKRRG
jgi:ADP-ribose pyrophosphatase YjhB (NUDIX family)